MLLTIMSKTERNGGKKKESQSYRQKKITSKNSTLNVYNNEDNITAFLTLTI